MRKYFLLMMAVVAGCTAFAQDFHTIYYKNGKKAMEGKWLYTREAYFTGNGLLNVILNQNNIEDAPRDLRRQMRFEDRLPANLSIICDGLIKVWYADGTLRAAITFKSGIASGPYKSYHHTGLLAEEGVLRDGQADGEWKMYDKAGKLELTGHYKAYPQDSLHLQLEQDFQNYDHSKGTQNGRAARRSWRRTYDGDEGNGDSAEVISSLKKTFYFVEAEALSDAIREGKFTAFYPDGSTKAVFFYKANIRDGRWDYFARPGARATSITYRNGRLVSATDSNGVVSGIDVLIQRRMASKERTDFAGPDVEAPPTRQVFRYVEQHASFNADVNRYLSEHIRYPKGKARVQGKAYVQFIVELDGSLSDATIFKSSGNAALDEEALRVVREMPAWIPGKNNGQAVLSYFTLPINFNRD